MRLESLTAADLPEVLALNEENVPDVGTLTSASLALVVRQSTLARVLRDEEGVAGFVVAMDPLSDYASLNYRWFCARLERFLYVDRIAVAARCRGQGLGRRLYADVFAEARARDLERVTCEVNLAPPNPGSLAFHGRLGFDRMGELQHVPGEKEVAMLVAMV